MPKNNSHEHDIQLDEYNKNTKWQYAIAAETDQKMEYETYKDLRHKHKAKPTTNFNNIRVHFV